MTLTILLFGIALMLICIAAMIEMLTEGRDYGIFKTLHMLAEWAGCAGFLGVLVLIWRVLS